MIERASLARAGGPAASTPDRIPRTYCDINCALPHQLRSSRASWPNWRNGSTYEAGSNKLIVNVLAALLPVHAAQ